MELHLIRHGDTEGTERRLYYGQTDLPLSSNGIANLQNNVRNGRYPALGQTPLFSTGLLRTEQTLALIYGDAPHGTLPQFQEISFGIFEMKCYEELQHRADYQTWITGDFPANVPPQGESFNQFTVRILSALTALIDQGDDAILVCHGGTISVIMNHLFPQNGQDIYHWIPEPGHGYSITLEQETCTQQAIPVL